jgi:hypothetical protein
MKQSLFPELEGKVVLATGATSHGTTTVFALTMRVKGRYTFFCFSKTLY